MSTGSVQANTCWGPGQHVLGWLHPSGAVRACRSARDSEARRRLRPSGLRKGGLLPGHPGPRHDVRRGVSGRGV